MTLRIHRTSSFKKDLKKIARQNKKLDDLELVILTLASRKRLAQEYNDHKLSNNWRGHRECHIKPDWLLIYSIKDDILYLVRTGSHSELFK
ncbi:MAG: type II toxin-antitoxin system YafQ family toxin [Alphaproteobacteria bacterium]|nr:type II toxin-antitoxin system YafQ family toxin [Alphaproteobacteria bacterium]